MRSLISGATVTNNQVNGIAIDNSTISFNSSWNGITVVGSTATFSYLFTP
jgi:hypothetical protein